MRVLSFPVRVSSDGSLVTVVQGSAQHAAQLASAIVSTFVGERALAPDVGVFDPVGVGVSEPEVVAAVDVADEDLIVTGVAISREGDRQRVDVSVQWATTEDDSGA